MTLLGITTATGRATRARTTRGRLQGSGRSRDSHGRSMSPDWRPECAGRHRQRAMAGVSFQV